MPLHRFVVGNSTMVFNNTSNSFTFNAFVPVLGQEPYPITWVLNEAPYLLVSALGGFSPSSSQAIDLRLLLNGTVLGVFQFPRWASHFVIVPTTTIVPIPRSVLTVSFSGAPVSNNVLVVESLTAADYFFLGPVVCHY
jgi:hypothetical protein